MLRTIARRADKVAFERPLALALAGSVAFAVLARSGIGVGRLVLAVILASLAALVADRITRRGAVRMPRRKTAPIPAKQADPIAESRQPVRLRRADRHPDAPPRFPIRAHSELGSPLMEIEPEPAPPAPKRASAGHGASVVDWPLTPKPHPEPAEPEVAEPEAVDAEPDILELDTPLCEPVSEAEAAPIAAFAPEEEPAPAPVRARRQSLTEMMDRLAAGLDRRAAEDGIERHAAAPALHAALQDLDRLAARRG